MKVLSDRYGAERKVIDQGLRLAVDRLPEPAAKIAAYHFGWTNAGGVNGSGKAVRPLLTLLSAKAVAGEWVSAVPAAVAVELVHNFSLVHDDIIDRDGMRRHRPTVWKAFGTTEALLVGDAMHALAFEIISESAGGRSKDGAALLAGTVRALIEGQLADELFEERAQVELSECVAMSEAKTASLMGCATALGALLAGGNKDHVESLREFGFRLGLAFQHIDDLLGIWGDPGVTGKSRFSDLRSRKKSLPVTAALESTHAEVGELTHLYTSQEPLSENDLLHVAELVEICGGRQASREAAEHLTLTATSHLTASGLDPEAVAELTDLAKDIAGRVQ